MMLGILAWLAAKAAGLMAVGRAWWPSARGNSAIGAIAVSAVVLAVAGVVGWISLAIHDVNVERRVDMACIARELLTAKEAELAATRKAVQQRDEHLARAAIREFASDEQITILEQQKETLRHALAQTNGDAAVVFGPNDDWLRARAATAAANARDRRPGPGPVR